MSSGNARQYYMHAHTWSYPLKTFLLTMLINSKLHFTELLISPCYFHWCWLGSSALISLKPNIFLTKESPVLPFICRSIYITFNHFILHWPSTVSSYTYPYLSLPHFNRYPSWYSYWSWHPIYETPAILQLIHLHLVQLEMSPYLSFNFVNNSSKIGKAITYWKADPSG